MSEIALGNLLDDSLSGVTAIKTRTKKRAHGEKGSGGRKKRWKDVEERCPDKPG